MTERLGQSGGRRDEWAGQWMCPDGDVFPTRDEAIEHLRANAPTDLRNVTSRIHQLPEFEEADPWAGEWEEVRLG